MIATVIIAIDGISIESQKLIYSARIAASQVRIAKAQEVRGKPNGQNFSCSRGVKQIYSVFLL